MSFSRAFSFYLPLSGALLKEIRICSNHTKVRTISYSRLWLGNPLQFNCGIKCTNRKFNSLKISREVVVGPSLCHYSSSEGPGYSNKSEGERKLKKVIRTNFPQATKIVVEDISGGCGSMYQIYVEAPEFQGLTTVKQHRLVNEVLKEEIKTMHGIRIHTAVAKKD